jgi:hypothetical protein
MESTAKQEFAVEGGFHNIRRFLVSGRKITLEVLLVVAIQE